MTEDEWEKAVNPSRMLDILRAKVSRIPLRKLRLYISACCRRLPPSMLMGRIDNALEAVEQFANGTITLEGINLVRAKLAADFRTSPRPTGQGWCRHILASNKLLWDATKALGNQVDTFRSRVTIVSDYWTELEASGCPIVPHERRVLCEFLYDIFGNPFRPVSFLPEWRTDTAVALARQVYD